MTVAAPTRRAFLTTLFAVPALLAGPETLIEWPDLPGLQTLGTAKQLAEALRDALTTRLPDETRVVGPKDARLGTAFKDGTFTTQFAVRTAIDIRNGKLQYDRGLLDGVSRGLADAIKRDHLQYFGTLALPDRLTAPEAAVAANTHVAVRVVTQYDIRTNAHCLGIDLLGAA